MQDIKIWSEKFRTGDNIPVEHTCDGADISPQLSWTDIPPDTKSIVLIMDDPDAPTGTFVHWVIFNIPAYTRSLPEGIPGYEVLLNSIIQGTNDFGLIGYGGPCPPPGKPHRYHFKIYALDIRLDLPPGVRKTDIENAMQGHILDKGELIGIYGR
jgi:Raf kinase inhibitor-like YbhB/YbcL family protein